MNFNLICLFVQLVFMAQAYAGPGKTVIRFPESLEVSHQMQYRLLDLVEIENPTESVVKQLWSLEVPSRWTQGSRFVLSEQQIMQVLRNKSFNKKNVEIIVSENVKPKKSEEILSKEHLSRVISTVNKSICGNCEFKVEFHNIPKVLLTEWEWDPFSTLFRGSFTTLIRMPDTRWSGWLTGSVKWQGPVLEVKKNFTYGQKITPDDLRISNKDITYQKDFLSNPEEVAGRVTTRSLGPGSALRVADFRKEEAVKRGQIVKTILGENDFEISISTMAEDTGTVGDRIRVKNLETQKLLSGEIVDNGVVRVQ